MKYPMILYSILLCSLWGDDLSSMMAQSKKNLRLESSRLEIDKSQSLLDEARTAYFPTVIASGIYQKKDRATAFEPKTIYGVELGAQITLFDGFRREALLDALHASKAGAVHTMEQEEQNVLMETIATYYDYLDTKDRIDVIAEKKKELDAQVKRYETLVKNDLATTDILKSLIASRLESDYNEHHLKTQLEQHRKSLELLCNTPINGQLEYRELSTPTLGMMDRSDLKSDQKSLEILKHTEDRYTYLPSITLGAKHKEMDYNDYDTMGGTNVQPAHQNEISASVSMTLFDMGRISKEREQARIDTLKTQKMIDYKTKKLQNDAQIALLSIQSAHNALLAADAEERARNEAFSFVKTRFDAGLINTTTYLSELSSLSDARAKARHAKNALQVAKAHAAYAYGTDLMSLIQEKK